MNINWNEMPCWADVWIEDLDDNFSDGWHRYCEHQDRYYDLLGFYYGSGAKNITIHYPPETKPEWSGEGLPPVGTVCLFNTGADGDYKKCLIAAHHVKDGMPIVDHLEIGLSLSHAPSCWKFHPIKSDRKKWVEKAVNIYFSKTPCDKLDIFGLLYDALISGELPSPKGSNNESK